MVGRPVGRGALVGRRGHCGRRGLPRVGARILDRLDPPCRTENVDDRLLDDVEMVTGLEAPRAPALVKPRVSVEPSNPTTWELVVRWIQVTRLRRCTVSMTSGQSRRTSTRPIPPGAGRGRGRRGLGSRGPAAGRLRLATARAQERLGGPARASCSGTGVGAGAGSGAAGIETSGAARSARDGSGRSWPGAEPVTGARAADGVPLIDTRRSSRSRRASTPSVPWSAAGSSTRAQISSSSSRGAVAPRMSVSPAATRSAARVSSARPNRAAWATSRSPWSSETSIRPVAGASGTAATMTRSRSRRSRSSVKRRGSWPVSITLSTTPNTAAPSPAANASTTSSSRVSGV